MARKREEPTVRLDKEKVIRLVKFKFGDVCKYCEFAGISRMRFYAVLNRVYCSKDRKSLQDLADNLNESIETILQ